MLVEKMSSTAGSARVSGWLGDRRRVYV